MQLKTLRIVITGTILVVAIGFVLNNLPSTARISAKPNIAALTIALEGERPWITSLDFSPSPDGGTEVDVWAQGTRSLELYVSGAGTDRPVDTKQSVATCVAIVGTCEEEHAIITYESGTDYYASGLTYRVVGSPRSANESRARFRIPPWGGTGYVVMGERGYIEVALPSVTVYSGGALAFGDTDVMSFNVNMPSNVPEVSWTAGVMPATSGPGWASWAEPIKNGQSAGVRAAGIVPDLINKNDANTLLTGILVGVACAAALALVSEIRPRELRTVVFVEDAPDASGVIPNHTHALLLAIARMQPHRASRLRRPTRGVASARRS